MNYEDTCTGCKNAIKCVSLGRCIAKKKSQYAKAKEGSIQMVLAEEKEKVFQRDGYKCIYCHAPAWDSHHVLWHNSERIYDPTRNKYYYEVALCRKCHEQVPINRVIDQHCRFYLSRLYGRRDSPHYIPGYRIAYVKRVHPGGTGRQVRSSEDEEGYAGEDNEAPGAI